jgi:hypothetical protein
VEELIIATQAMVGGELRDEKTWSSKDLVEEASQLAPWKSKNKKMGEDEAGLNKTKAHEKTLPLVK